MTALSGDELELDLELERALAERKRLRSAPAKAMEFSGASVSDVLRFLAEDAGVPYLFPEGVVGDETLVSFKWEQSPFSAFENIALSNGYQLAKEGDAWTVVPFDPGGVERALETQAQYEDLVDRPAAENEVKLFQEEAMGADLSRLIKENGGIEKQSAE